MKNGQKASLIFINVVCILALVVILFPLLWVGQYNYPIADDWSHGVNSYRAVQNGGGIFAVLAAAAKTAWNAYLHIEGRFVGVFFAALQPGIWGEEYYAIVPWILLGSIVLSEMFLFKSFLCASGNKEMRWYWIPIIVPTLIMQIFYCPFPEESFYWYTGAMNYTFSYALSLIVLVLFWKAGTKLYSPKKYFLMLIITSILAFLVGGMNFGTSLSCFLTLCVVTVFWWIFDRKAVRRTWIITAFSGLSLLLCILAPGNISRINNNFGGETGGIIEAVFMSLVRSGVNIYSWTNSKVIILILFIIPFAWKCAGNLKWKFKFPVLFTFFSFGLYASQIAATMYVDGTTGGGRMAAILYYSYYVWIIGNIVYWLGWLKRKDTGVKKWLENVCDNYSKLLLPYCAILGVALVGLICIGDLREVSSYCAYRDWRQGLAQQFEAEWDARLEVLRDDTVKDAVFVPLTAYPEVFFYADLQTEDGHLWVNNDCAHYYGKDSIKVISTENSNQKK